MHTSPALALNSSEAVGNDRYAKGATNTLPSPSASYYGCKRSILFPQDPELTSPTGSCANLIPTSNI